jgi:8-oxo-dGTP diphosphatase
MATPTPPAASRLPPPPPGQRWPGVGVGLFLHDACGRFVLMRRRGAHGAGTWGLVGGNNEYGQSPQEAAADEALQEVGVELDPAEIALGPFTNDFFPDEGKHYVTLFVSARIPEGAAPSIREPHKCSEIGMFSFDDLPGPLFVPFRNFLGQRLRPPFA